MSKPVGEKTQQQQRQQLGTILLTLLRYGMVSYGGMVVPYHTTTGTKTKPLGHLEKLPHALSLQNPPYQAQFVPSVHTTSASSSQSRPALVVP